MENNLAVPNNDSDPSRRRSSFLPFDFSETQRRSPDSLYSSLNSLSISISGSSSSADSITVGKIQNINKELIELISSRLTAFAYFGEVQNPEINQKVQLQSSINGIEDLKTSLLNELSDKSPQNVLIVTSFLKELSDLQRLYSKELEKLRDNQEELETLENEEIELNSRLHNIENKFSHMTLETQGQKTTCRCEII
jgi:hypothetical protein